MHVLASSSQPGAAGPASAAARSTHAAAATRFVAAIPHSAVRAPCMHHAPGVVPRPVKACMGGVGGVERGCA